MLQITQGKGFQITFKNGWTVSVQWGPGNYCDKHDTVDYMAPKSTNFWESTTAEVAAWDSAGTWYDFGADTVDGYKTADEVAIFIKKIAEMK